MTSTLRKPAAQPLNAPTLHRLANGLTIVAEQMPVDAVNLNVWLNVGSAVETDSINGMAHFLEHMIFKGTAQLQSGEFERCIEQRGAVTNAATSQDYTHYYITTAPQDFADLAPLQIDVLMNASIPNDGFERERQVVLEEIRRSQDNVRRRTFQQATELTFDRLPYRRQVLGPTTVIEQLTAQQMRDFHQQWYQPQAMTAAVVGNLPVDELIRIVEASFVQAASGQRSAISRQPLEAQHSKLKPLAPEPPFETIVRRELTDASLTQARLIMAWRVPGLNDLQQTYVLDVLASVLSHGRTTRLVQDLREQRGLVSSISASNLTYQHQGAFYISAQLPTENLAIVEAAIVQHLHDLQADLISEAEVARIRTRVANHFIFGSETPSDRAGLYGYYQALVGDLSAAIDYPTHIQALDAEAVRAAAQTYLSPTAYGVVTIKPEANEGAGT
ncbi:insulinase family protein [Leptolyngbya sp. FACHB-321]|uniref:M16 family metallopeptidase n=1 Tax=Leptolyngbya sp. FACHB-321 TaxID=2692807 RepID=UPI00168949C1|nr:pitrilysin family protein [Leptolyngbya sp. FACHB-321]MBD2038708.1 insulinase family protein [Leptolyngbya sp. FACHB-321]